MSRHSGPYTLAVWAFLGAFAQWEHWQFLVGATFAIVYQLTALAREWRTAYLCACENDYDRRDRPSAQSQPIPADRSHPR